ncbi:hypothetical protein SRHO_G00139560 [Serrasalmus rhombeus]
MSNANQRLTCWSLILQGFNLTIIQKKGADDIVADTLDAKIPFRNFTLSAFWILLLIHSMASSPLHLLKEAQGG